MWYQLPDAFWIFAYFCVFDTMFVLSYKLVEDRELLYTSIFIKMSGTSAVYTRLSITVDEVLQTTLKEGLCSSVVLLGVKTSQ
jgi:hypothetical protein